MQAEIVSIRDISAEDVALWNAWAAPGGVLASPYFRFGFTQAVAQARADVRIARFSRDGQTIAFFPHHAPSGGVVRPVGAPMSDYQGVIAAPGETVDAQAALRACGGSALVYDNWYAPLGGRPIPSRGRSGSSIADLSAGAQSYFDNRRALWKDHFKKSDRRKRAAERDHGPLRLELADESGAVFSRLMDWKSGQYAATGKFDVLGVPWVRQVLDGLRRSEGEVKGLTASLWFGDRLAAAEFGLMAGGVYHSWFPAYDADFARYSPGLLLMHAIMEEAGALGIDRFDLGGGDAPYKKYYASWEAPLDSGRSLAPGMAAAMIQSWEAAEAAARILPDRLAQLPARCRRRWAQISAFEPALGPRVAAFAGAMRQQSGAAA